MHSFSIVNQINVPLDFSEKQRQGLAKLVSQNKVIRDISFETWTKKLKDEVITRYSERGTLLAQLYVNRMNDVRVNEGGVKKLKGISGPEFYLMHIDAIASSISADIQKISSGR